MKFRVEIDTDHNVRYAGADREEGYQLIINAMKDVLHFMELEDGSGPFAYRIRDVNGNTVGRTSFDED